MNSRFGIVNGANRWRVIELVDNLGGFAEFIYATDPLKTRAEALAAIHRFTRTASAAGFTDDTKTLTVFRVEYFDAMASNWGEYVSGNVYLKKEDAEHNAATYAQARVIAEQVR